MILCANFSSIIIMLKLKDMKVVIIGSGNVATVMGRLIQSAGHSVIEVISRNIHHASVLANELDAKANDDINAITQEADIYIMAVSDSAIEKIAGELLVENKMIVHTSGSVSKDILKNSSSNYGVLYPLQSLRSESVHIPVIPLLIDGNTDAATKSIVAFAESISEKVSVADDAQRLKLHVAAVVVSNFTNYLYTLTADFCKKEQVDFSVLFPLIAEVALRLNEYEPKKMQTGPAVRRDSATIEKHNKLLATYPELQKIYGEMTVSISNFYRN